MSALPKDGEEVWILRSFYLRESVNERLREEAFKNGMNSTDYTAKIITDTANEFMARQEKLQE